MTAETLEKLYQVMVEMEDRLEDTKTVSVPMEVVEKWFSFLQFSVIKELTGKNEVIVIKESEIKDAVEKRVITESYQSEHQD